MNAQEQTTHTINIKNSDRILLIGGSFTSGGARDFKDKGNVSTVSQLVDWTVEGYGHSGDCYQAGAMAVQQNEKRYHASIGPQDYNITKVISGYAENDQIYYNLLPAKYWRDNMMRYAKIMKSIGANPVFATPFGNLARSMIYAIMRDVAHKEKCDFIDNSSGGSRFNTNRYLPFWNNGHPGLRTNSLLWYNIVQYINTIERPRQGIKVFRNRRAFSAQTLDDYRFDAIPERMRKWREISIGHRRSTDETVRYYDALDLKKIESLPETSEYLKLINRETVSFETLCLLQITFPATSSHIESAILRLTSNEKLTAHVRRFVDASSRMPGRKTGAGFRLTDPHLTLHPGDIYISDRKNHHGAMFTVLFVRNGVIVCSVSGEWETVGLQDGVLTRHNGTGPTTVAFTGTLKTPDSQYMKEALAPKGSFEKVDMHLNALTMDRDFLKRRMDYDKIYVVLSNNGHPFSLKDIQIEWRGEEVKDRRNRPLVPVKTGCILQASTFDDETGNSWTLPEGVYPEPPSDKCVPKGIQRIVELQPGQSMSLPIELNLNAPTLARIRCWARCFLPIFNPEAPFQLRADDPPGDNAINEDSYDFGELTMAFQRQADGSDLDFEFQTLVPLHWQEIEQEVYITSPKEKDTYLFAIKAVEKTLQIAFVSIESATITP